MPITTVQTSDLIALGHPIDIRPPDHVADSIDGVVPGTIVQPRTADAVAATLAWASERRLSVVIRGAGTKSSWGRIPQRVDLLLDMRALNRVIAHRQGDLTVTAEAGLPLGGLNQALAAHGQWLPLDPPFAGRATIGGLLATNDSGPRRHRFGTPRDLVIGVQIATTDGQLTRSGGQVVKNVAGYDLSKLLSGSCGQLAAIVGATFKLLPRQSASNTLVIDRLDAAALARVISAVFDSQLEPSAFEVHAVRNGSGSEATRCLLRFESVPDVVHAEVAAARARVGAVHSAIEVVEGEAEERVWRRHDSVICDGRGLVVRASWLPAQLPHVIDQLPRLAAGCDCELTGRIGVGAGLLRLDGAPARQIDAVERLRGSSAVGNIVVTRAGVDIKSKLDVWGALPNRAVVESIKRELDPHGTLGANRGPL